MKAHRSFTDFHPVRRDRLIQEEVHDTYKSRTKLPEPTVCPGCGAVFHEGRWQWAAKPVGAHEEMCPACHRIYDEFPAGYLTLGGKFFQAHREEILHLVRNEGEREKTEHPLKRIINIEDHDDGVLVTTTSIHMARRIGDAVHHAYQGGLEFHYNEEENLLRVNWTR